MKYFAFLCSVLLLVTAIGCGGGGSSNPVSTTATPQISGISPQSGSPGTVVQIWGAYFGSQQGTSLVYYNHEPCVVNSWTDTLITCVIPNTARANGTFVITVGGKSSVASTQFTLNAPQITSISPSSGPADTLVTISGIGFGTKTDNSRVSFNGYNAVIETWSNSYITCRVPQGPQNGSVSVVVYISYDYYVTSTFSFVLPAISSIAAANTNSSGNNIGAELAVNGQGFGSYQNEYNGILKFGSTQVAPTSWTSNRITFRIPTGVSAGYSAITLTVNGKSINSGWNVYTPAISNPNLSTSFAQGDLVTLTGNYLGLSTDQASRLVKFGDTTVTSFVSWTDTGIAFYNPLSGPLIGTENKTVSVVVGGLESNQVTVKIK